MMDSSSSSDTASQPSASPRDSVDESFADKLLSFGRRDSMDSENNNNVAEAPSLFADLWQTQFTLWTFTFSTVFTRVWQKRVRLLNSLAFAVGSFAVASVLSGLLAFLVVAAHVFGKGGRVGKFADSFSSDSVVDGWASPRMQRRLSTSSYCSGGDVRSRHSSGARSPVYKNQPVFWERKMSMEQNYFGRLSRC